MRLGIINKWPSSRGLKPNLEDYAAACAAFSWDQARAQLAGLPGGGLNIAHEAVERHVLEGRGDHIAFHFLSAADRCREVVSFATLSAATNRFANVLRGLGVGKGDRLFLLCGRIPELYTAALGAMKNGTVVSPLFSAFGPEPIATRMQAGAARVLVTTESLYLRKVAGIRNQLPLLEHVLLVGENGAVTQQPGTLDLAQAMAAASDSFATVFTTADDEALLHFTSGTTGRPKGAVHVHGAVLTHHVTGRYALDLHAGDTYWCTADPGWVTGMSYGVITPLLHGVTSIVEEGEFDAARWYDILADEQVSVWYTAPTAIRMLMKAGATVAHARAYPRLRYIASVGEPLNPEAVWWGEEVLGLPIHDNWWQTETGGIMIANFLSVPIKPGSMGLPLPGIEACIVDRPEHGRDLRVIDRPGVRGELALKAGWPSMFRGYLNEELRYRQCFAGDLYLTGDLAMRDADGYYWFVGRADDVIKSAGHLIGPFEVESALMEHEAVAEAGVIGKPDPVYGETVKAFISLKGGREPSDALRMELLAHARKRLGAAVAPKEIAFLPALPRTRSGKILRRLLKARELGLPEGDLSTLEPGG